MSRLHQLSQLGQSVWIDFLSRDLLDSGSLARAVRDDAVVGVTSNPTIFEQAISRGDAYDIQLASSGSGDAKHVFLSLAMRDVANGCDLLRPVWEQTEGRDGYVSIEVDPHLAHDTQATIDEATFLHDAIAKPNLLVKIPATHAGLSAIEEMTARGYSINVTLIFSLTRHHQVMEAYLAGLERLVAAGGDPRSVHSVASFFVSRVDTETDRRLHELGRDDLKTPRHRQRQARLPAIQGGVPRSAVGGAGHPRRHEATLPLGVDLDKGREPARHALRRTTDRAGEHLDHAGSNHPRLPGPRPRRPHARITAR